MDKNELLKQISDIIEEPLKKFTRERFLKRDITVKTNLQNISKICIDMLCHFIEFCDCLEIFKENSDIYNNRNFYEIYNSTKNWYEDLKIIFSCLVIRSLNNKNINLFLSKSDIVYIAHKIIFKIDECLITYLNELIENKERQSDTSIH